MSTTGSGGRDGITWVRDPLADLVGRGDSDCKIHRTCVCYKDDGSKLVCPKLLNPTPKCTNYHDGL